MRCYISLSDTPALAHSASVIDGSALGGKVKVTVRANGGTPECAPELSSPVIWPDAQAMDSQFAVFENAALFSHVSDDRLKKC